LAPIKAHKKAASDIWGSFQISEIHSTFLLCQL